MTQSDSLEKSRKVLDLCCSAGGASAGYASLGWEVTGIDNKPQARYPYSFIEADALEVAADVNFLSQFDLIHASFPCQLFLHGRLKTKRETHDLVTPGRELLKRSGIPWVMENVITAPLDKEKSIVLCGNSFKLRTYRHRRFEYPKERFRIRPPVHKDHLIPTSQHRSQIHWDMGYFFTFTGGETYENQTTMWDKFGKDGMGIDWMTRYEISQAIPPAYTRWIGRQLIKNKAFDS
jgi:DNA (cytosine-5)-methyltransferase 1